MKVRLQRFLASTKRRHPTSDVLYVPPSFRLLKFSQLKVIRVRSSRFAMNLLINVPLVVWSIHRRPARLRGGNGREGSRGNSVGSRDFYPEITNDACSKLLGSGAALRYEWSRDGGYRTRMMTRRIVETILNTRGTARGGDGQFPGWSWIARDLLRKTTDSFLRSPACHAPGSQLRSSGLPRIILFRPCRCSCLIIIQRDTQSTFLGSISFRVVRRDTNARSKINGIDLFFNSTQFDLWFWVFKYLAHY